ncbi:TPA: hypothetical protein ACH3X2_002578 [Trebouxia sp. C0005]
MQSLCTTASAGPARQLRPAWQSSSPTKVLKCWSQPIMALQVERWDSQKHGKLSSKTMLKRLRDEGYSGSTYQLPPGTHFPPHTHDCDKKDSIITGRFKFVSKDHGEVSTATLPRLTASWQGKPICSKALQRNFLGVNR